MATLKVDCGGVLMSRNVMCRVVICASIAVMLLFDVLFSVMGIEATDQNDAVTA